MKGIMHCRLLDSVARGAYGLLLKTPESIARFLRALINVSANFLSLLSSFQSDSIILGRDSLPVRLSTSVVLCIFFH